jgi:protein CpxP
MNITKPMKTIVSISTMCAVLAFASVSNANVSEDNVDSKSHKHHQKSERHHKGRNMMKKMGKYLDLSDEQKTQIKSIRTQAKAQHEPLRVEMKQFKEAEKLLLQAKVFDEAAYITLHTSYQPTFSQASLAKAQTKNAIFNVLTAEQQVKWVSKMEKRKDKMKRKSKNKSEKKETVNKD